MAQLASILDSTDHHVAPLELVTNLAANALPHCLGLPLWPHHLALSWYLHQSKSPQLSFNNITGGQTSGPKDRTLKNRDGRTDGKLNSRSRITRSWWFPLSKQSSAWVTQPEAEEGMKSRDLQADFYDDQIPISTNNCSTCRHKFVCAVSRFFEG